MILDQLQPGFYSQSNRALVAAFTRDRFAVIDRWQDGASEAALAGNPRRAAYIEWCISRFA